jgi:hypothetical protein
MQPTFLPWTGYFALIDAADIFVFLNDFEFRRRSWHQRNRLFVDGGGRVGWWTIPVEHVGGDHRPTLEAARPALTPAFRRAFLTRLRQVYGGSEHYKTVGIPTEQLIEHDWPSLAALNIAWIQLAMRLMGITTPSRLSSSVGSTGRRSVRIASLLRRVGACRYLAAYGSARYMLEDGVFPLEGIETLFQVYEPAPYPQRQSREFVPYLSMLDVMLQLGGQRALEVVRLGARRWLSWETMLATASD